MKVLNLYAGIGGNRKLWPPKPIEERNMVNPKLGLHIFNCAFKEKQQTL